MLGDLGNNIDGFIEVSQQPSEFGYRKPSLEVVGRNLLRLTEETAMSHPSKAQLPDLAASVYPHPRSRREKEASSFLLAPPSVGRAALGGGQSGSSRARMGVAGGGLERIPAVPEE